MPAIREAIDIERELEGTEGTRRALLLSELAWVLRSDDPPRAVATADEAAAALARRDPDERVLAARARLLVVRAIERRSAGDAEASRRFAQQALESSGLFFDLDALALAHCVLASLDHLRGRQEAARKRLNEVLREVPEGDDRARIGRASLHNELGRVAFVLQEWTEAHACFAKALDESVRAGDKRFEGVLHVNLGNVYSQLRDWDSALEHYRRALKLQRERRNLRGQSLALQNLAVVQQRLGDLNEALRCAGEAVELLERVDEAGQEAVAARIQHARLLLEDGRAAEAAPLIDAVVASAREAGGPHLCMALCLAAEIAEGESAAGLIDEAIVSLEGVEDTEPILDAKLVLARVRREEGRGEEALEFARQVTELARRSGAINSLCTALALTETVSEELGRPEEALAALRERHATVVEEQRRAARGRHEVLRTRHALERALNRERSLEEMREELELEVARRTEELLRANEELAEALHEKLRTERERELLADQLRQAQKMEAVGRLAGGIAHDFNNLLTVLRGHGELLLAALEEGSDEHESAQQVVESCDRAARLTSQLLAFSRHRPREDQPVEAGELLGGLERMLRRLLGEQVELQLERACASAWVRIDPVALEQVVLNLAINARDAMPEGGTLTITLDRRPPDSAFAGEASELVALLVSDTGTGIPPETIDLIFEPFFTTKPPGEGTGLGLATSYGLVRQAGGSLRVDSTPGSGSTFEVLLPAIEAPAGDKEGRAAAAALPEGPGRRILLVEDEPALRHLLRAGLQSLGHEVSAAGDGQEALEILDAEGGFDVVVSDVVMPRMGGPELLRELRRRGPGPPVLLTSGWPDRAGDPPGRLGVEFGFLEKPFRLAELVRAVEDLLAG